MPESNITINFKVYFDDKGNHTCRLNETERCQFLLCRKFGFVPVCGFGEQVDLVNYNHDETGYIKPKEGCPFK